MAEKQLAILVTARDQASGVLNNVGGAVKSVASGGKEGAEGMDQFGRSINQTLRAARGLLFLAEVVPSIVNVFKALDAGMFGSFEDSVGAQRNLVNGLKEIPIVGKPVGEFTEWLGGKISHMFGRESLSEQEADIKAQKENLKKFQSELAKADQEAQKSDEDVKLIGLGPGDEEIERAKVQYEQAIEKLKPYKQAVAAGVAAGADVSGLVGDIKRITDDAKAVEADAIAKANNKILVEEMAFGEHLREEAVHRADAIAQIEEQISQKKLEAQNRGFEAEMAGIQNQTQRKIAAIQEDARKRMAEIDKQMQDLAPAANAVAPDDADDATKKRIAESAHKAMVQRGKLAEESWNIEQGSIHQQMAEQKLGKEDATAAREKELDQSVTAILREEADAGDQVAQIKLKNLEYTKQQQTQENALKAIINDANATDKQRAEAAFMLNELKKAGAAHDKHEAEQQHLADVNQQREAAAFLLEREAAAGDKTAAIRLKQLQIEKEYAEERKKLQDIINSGTASAATKDEAKKSLAQLDTQEARDMKLAAMPKDAGGGDRRAAFEESGHLHGVSESVEEKNEFQPLLDEGKQHTGLLTELVGHFKEFMRVISTPGNRVPIR